MNSIKAGTLNLSGATIYYEIQGSGPVLLMIPGGPTDAGIFSALARTLADRHTVVAYDPRGNSRSSFDGVPEEQQLDVHGDDAAQLIAALGNGPADVFGSSGGAQIGLNLAARYPAQVRTLVAHEPPCVLLLADSAKEGASVQAAFETYLRDGVEPAMRQFMQFAGLNGAPQSQNTSPQAGWPPEAADISARMDRNLDYFFAHGIRPIALYRPDVAALRKATTRIVVGIGEQSTGQIGNRAAIALAERLGIDPVTFPGDHTGYVSCPVRFAETLRGVLTVSL